jgi:oxygen-independent coproporphyrinogen-3 oxidase
VGGIESIFIGGGTPSTIDPELYRPIFQLLNPYLRGNIEITVEANPNSATLEWLQAVYELGVNRVSFGVQSFHMEKLKGLNRNHTPKQAIDSVKNAEKVGFKNISIDLIYNYMEDTEGLLKGDIDMAFSLPINHISAYELTIEAGTKFAQTPNIKQEREDLAFFVAEEITRRGFQQYEVSNFGLYESYHNKGYWRLKDYIGVGAGAVGFQWDSRYYPTSNVENYIENPLQIDTERLTEEEILTEKIFLGLRSTVGVDEKILTQPMRERANILVEAKRLQKENGIYQNRNFFLSDEVALYLIMQ